MATHAAAGVEPISLVQDVLDNAYLVVQRVSGEQTVEEIVGRLDGDLIGVGDVQGHGGPRYPQGQGR